MRFFSKKKKPSKEWIQNTLEHIERLNPEYVPPKTEYSDVRYSIHIDEEYEREREEKRLKAEYRKWERNHLKRTFQQKLFDYINRAEMTNKEFYKAARIDRKLFSAINTNMNYKPSKETAVACCLALKLDIEDAKYLMGLAGYMFSMAIPWDRVVYYCINNGIYDIDTVNDLLYELDLKLIGRI